MIPLAPVTLAFFFICKHLRILGLITHRNQKAKYNFKYVFCDPELI